MQHFNAIDSRVFRRLLISATIVVCHAQCNVISRGSRFILICNIQAVWIKTTDSKIEIKELDIAHL